MKNQRFFTAGNVSAGALFTCIMLCIFPWLVAEALAMSDFMNGRFVMFTIYQLGQAATFGSISGVVIGQLLLKTSNPTRKKSRSRCRVILPNTSAKKPQKILYPMPRVRLPVDGGEDRGISSD